MATNVLTLQGISDFLSSEGMFELFDCVEVDNRLHLTAKGLSLKFRVEIWCDRRGGFDWRHCVKAYFPGDIDLTDPQHTNHDEIDDVLGDNITWSRFRRDETLDTLVVALRYIRLGCERFYIAARFRDHVRHLDTRIFIARMEPGTVETHCCCTSDLSFEFLSRYSCRIRLRRCRATYDTFDTVKERMNGFEEIILEGDNEDQLFEEAKEYYVRYRELILELHPPERYWQPHI